MKHRDDKAGGSSDFKSAITWEASRIHQLELSERRAWRVAIGGGVLAVLAFAGIVLLMPLKESVPFVVRVDQTTGQTDLLTRFNAKDVAFDEVMDKYWLAEYVMARESYDWYSLQFEYNTTRRLSSDNVVKILDSELGGPNSVVKQRGNRVRVTVKILTVVPAENRTATVRYTTTQTAADGSGAPVVVNHVATIAYDYKATSVLPSDDRLFNPFGFVVNSYRTDREMGGL